MGEFAIAFDAGRRRLDVRIDGQWDIASAVRYRQALAAHAPRAAPFDMIVDIQAASVLPRDAVSEIEASLADLASKGLRCAAHITTSALSVLQIRRIGSSHAVMAFFATRTEALNWLESSTRAVAGEAVEK